MVRIVTRSGVRPWRKLFQTLRASAEADWAASGVPAFMTARWAGHSVTVAGRHYLTADHAGSIEKVTKRVAHFPAQNAPELRRTGVHSSQVVQEKPSFFLEDSQKCIPVHMEAEGIEPSSRNNPNGSLYMFRRMI